MSKSAAKKKSQQQQQSQQQHRQSIMSMSSIKLDNSEGKINYKSSQNEMRGHDDFPDFEDYDLSGLATDVLYKSTLAVPNTVHSRDAYLVAEETVRRLLSNTWVTLSDRELNLKIPTHSIFKTLETAEKALSIEEVCHDDSKRDYLTKGLREDLEPQTIFQDAWLRAKIHVDTLFKEEEQPARTLPLSRPNDVQSKRRSSKASSIAATMTHTNRRNNNLDQSGYHQNTTTKNAANMLPAPIDLSEPLNVSMTEEKMRMKKDEERREREEKIVADALKRQNMIIEEQQKFTKFQKENKTAGFTYDYTGELIAVQKVKVNKLPPTAQSVQQFGFGFKEDESQQQKDSKKKKTKKGAEPISKFKKAPEPEKEFARLVSNPPPIFDNIPLKAGVALTFDGRKRIGPAASVTEIQTLSMPSSNGQKIRLGRKEYDDIIKSGGFNRQKLDNPDFAATQGAHGGGSMASTFQQRFIATAPDPRMTALGASDKDNQEMKNTARQKFLQKIQQQTIGGKAEVMSGKIKVQSAKVYETLAALNSDDEHRTTNELVEMRRREQLLAASQHSMTDGKLGKSPIDEFNLQITKQQEWGKSHYGAGGQGPIQYAKHKTTQRDIEESLGKNRLKPRERILINSATGSVVQPMDLRASTSEGFFRRNLKTSEGVRVGTSHAAQKHAGATAVQQQQQQQSQLQVQSGGQKRNG